MEIKIKKLRPDAVIPTKAHPTDAGFDLTAISVEYDHLTDSIVYHTGLAFEIPQGYAGFIFPRSSIYKKNAMLTNSVGIVDSCYRGEVLAKFKRITPDSKMPVYDIGERVAQMVIMPYPEIIFTEADELSDSDRGTGGYGSSGN